MDDLALLRTGLAKRLAEREPLSYIARDYNVSASGVYALLAACDLAPSGRSWRMWLPTRSERQEITARRAGGATWEELANRTPCAR